MISFGKFVLVALIALVCGCGASLPPKATASGKKIAKQVTKTATEADVEAIRDLLNRLTSAINTNNSQHSAAVFTAQGTLLPHGEHTVVGNANIRAWFESQFAHSIYRDTAMAIDEVELGGNWAFARGPYHQLVTPRSGGAPVPVQGKYLLTFERHADGHWQVANAIWNLDEQPGSRPEEEAARSRLHRLS